MKVCECLQVEMLENLRKFSEVDAEVCIEDLELFTRCFKSYIGFKRNQFRKLVALIVRDSLTEEKKETYLLNLLKGKLSEEIIVLCNKAIEISQNMLKPNKNPNKYKKAKLFFLKTISDHYRYIHEVNEDPLYKDKANDAYKDALLCAENDKFPSTDIIYLTFFLNYSVFLHDTMNDKAEAVRIAKTTLHAALRDTEEIVDNNQKDIILICQMIKDNLSLWKNEIPEDINEII